MSSLFESIHSRALEASARYKQLEADLIEILQQIEAHRVYLRRGHSSLFAYVTGELGISENAAYTLITVARKAREVPALKDRIRSGSLTISNARRVATVVTPQNQNEWIEKASQLSARQLEKEIAKVKPEKTVPERASYISGDRVKLELGLSEKEMLKLRRIQDILSQSRKRTVSLEEVITALSNEFLRRNDPVEKARRNQVKNGSPKAPQLVTLRVSGTRPSIPRQLLHQINFRDQRRCAYTLPNGARCNQTRWIEIHHKKPLSEGGGNTLENLVTLCSAHHKLHHLRP